MSNTTEKRLPVTVKQFNSAAAFVSVRRWPDRTHEDGTKEPGNVFVEVAQDSGRKDGNKSIYNRVQFQLADLGGVIETLNRAKTVGIQTEDSR